MAMFCEANEWLDGIFGPPIVCSLSFWFRQSTADSTGSRRIVGINSTWVITINGSKNNRIGMRMNSNTQLLTADGDRAVKGVWHHFVGTVAGTSNSQRKTYFDGNLSSLDYEGAEDANANTFSIGRRGDDPDLSLFFGDVVDVRIYNRVLNEGEVTSIYNLQGADGIVNGLIHRWLLKDGSVADDIPAGVGAVKDIAGSVNLTRRLTPQWESDFITVPGGIFQNV